MSLTSTPTPPKNERHTRPLIIQHPEKYTLKLQRTITTAPVLRVPSAGPLGCLYHSRYPPPTNPAYDRSSVWQRVDFLDSITSVAALVLFNFPWNQGLVVAWLTPNTYIIVISA
ncbi:major facilitator superfamily transporter [Penicillium robsamsonii]|uniref:major facilitator superfamily transporter n=1 Tax=Penicillium robsamsonii TaxID=1792511 RepID=UPI0025493238|nr:major facilitator superfamily transporter [Penicillium robsamsonii]KAJ5827295.1 major facilitator superfamily transporter [Penicillium robsamsonii]